MSKCEIRWCGVETEDLIYVSLSVGDARWRVGICQECASKLGLKAIGDLPDYNPFASIKRSEY